jgi:hypothetical protein
VVREEQHLSVLIFLLLVGMVLIVIFSTMVVWVVWDLEEMLTYMVGVELPTVSIMEEEVLPILVDLDLLGTQGLLGHGIAHIKIGVLLELVELMGGLVVMQEMSENLESLLCGSISNVYFKS